MIANSCQTRMLHAICAAILLFVVPGGGAAQDVLEKSFDVKSGGTLTIEADLGSIEITTSGREVVEVNVERDVRGSGREVEELLEDLKIDMQQNGDDVKVTAKFEDGWSWRRNRRNRLRIHFAVVVPRRYNVDLKTAGGSISVDDLEGEVESRTSGGSLHFGNIQGPVIGRTSGGSISLEGCKGNAELKTSGGSISIGEVDGVVEARTSGGSIKIEKSGGRVYASTSGGNVNVNEVMGQIEASTSGGTIHVSISRQPEADCRLTTSGGSIYVNLAEGIKLDVNARTSGGRVKTEFPVTIQGELRKNALQAKINGGGPELYLRTSGGSIYLQKL